MIEVKDLKTYADYQRYNFFRTPEWRWERVLALADRPGNVPGRCTKRDDPIVREAKQFYCKRVHGDPQTLDKLLVENPGLFYAYDYHERLQDDPDAAMYIQARLLARQTPEQIGDILGILPAA